MNKKLCTTLATMYLRKTKNGSLVLDRFQALVQPFLKLNAEDYLISKFEYF